MSLQRGWLDRVVVQKAAATLLDQTYSHTPDGLIAAIASPDPALAWTYGYDGLDGRAYIDERYDPETGLQYLHARYYDPLLGVRCAHLSPDSFDPILSGVDVNRYAYASNDPINGSDRNGHAGGVNLGNGCDAACADAFIGAVIDVSPFGSIGEFAEADAAYNEGRYLDGLYHDAMGVAGIVPASRFAIKGVNYAVKGGKALVSKIGRTIDPAWAGKIRGFAQDIGKDTWHADASYQKAVEYAKNPEVAEVHLNRPLDAILGTGNTFRTRPDVTVVYKDGSRVRVCECVSPSQTAANMMRKNLATERKLQQQGKTPSNDVIERSGPIDPTGGKPTGSAPRKGNWIGAPQ